MFPAATHSENYLLVRRFFTLLSKLGLGLGPMLYNLVKQKLLSDVRRRSLYVSKRKRPAMLLWTVSGTFPARPTGGISERASVRTKQENLRKIHGKRVRRSDPSSECSGKVPGCCEWVFIQYVNGKLRKMMKPNLLQYTFNLDIPKLKY